jgi:hypothetical protein
MCFYWVVTWFFTSFGPTLPLLLRLMSLDFLLRIHPPLLPLTWSMLECVCCVSRPVIVVSPSPS